MRIKICGLTTADAVEAAVDAGVDAIGFVMSPSPRQADQATVKNLMRTLPPWVASVVVTRQPSPDFVTEVLPELVPTWWQSDLSDFDRQTPPKGTRLLPVIREGEDTTSLPEWFVYEGVDSGQGATIDWSVAAALARRGRMILAGGLDPENIGNAIEAVKPFGVDVSSGVESRRGVKDVNRIREFVAAVRQCEREQQ